MALTKVSTPGIKDDAVDQQKIADECILNGNINTSAAIQGSKLADNSISLAKLQHGDSNNNGKFLRANNGADPSFESIPAGTTINSNANNRLITGSDTSDTLNAEQYLTYTSQSSLDLTDGNGTSNLGGNYLLLKRSTGNTNYLVAPLTDADLVISADRNLLFQTDHSADFNSTERMRLTSTGRLGIGTNSPGHKFQVADSNTAIGFSRNGQNAQIIFDSNLVANCGIIEVPESSGGGAMQFFTKDTGGTLRERGRFLVGGGLTFNGDTADANAISDYEEGTFTPTNTVGMTLTNNHTARYTKIGRMVYIQMDFTFSGANDVSQCGLIQSLPFTSMGSSHYTQGAIQFVSEGTNSGGTGKLDHDDNNMLLWIGPNESSINIWNITSGVRQTRSYLHGRRFRISMWYTAT